ncbi:MAG: zincin-like metallopeptidase domain-containing protein [Rhodospirillales bacterium]
MSSEARKDIYSRVTDRILADLAKGVRSWVKPWNAEHAAGRITRPLRHNGTPYKGINVLLLWGEAVERGFAAPIWMTFRQAKQLGACVRKGEKGSLVVYADKITRTERNDNGEDVERQIPFMRGYTVFNVEQVEGLLPHYHASANAQPLDPIARIDSAERFCRAIGADIRHGGTMAYYAIHNDHVQMPPFESFADAESYYGTLTHELTHWTRHPKRLDRDFGRKARGDEGYAREELVAELGAAFLSADLGITPDVREDHAAYIGHWLKVLDDDKRFIFSAAAHAQRAADYLHSLQPKTDEAHQAAA